MSSQLTNQVIDTIHADRLRHAERVRPLRALRRRRRTVEALTEAVTVRLARPADSSAISALAQLDDAPRPDGRVILAEVHGDVVAALPLDGGRPVADPFEPTAAIVDLLKLRRRQLAA
jgi:hypothetical protein